MGKIGTNEEIQLLNGDVTKEMDKKGYEYLSLLRRDKLREKERKEAFRKKKV